MRLWTVHPRYLDVRGLGAVWREGLLALRVLEGRTRGYRHHPELTRFRALSDPAPMVARYLRIVCAEAGSRGYRYDASKLAMYANASAIGPRIAVSFAQVAFEREHLHAKLRVRDPARASALPLAASIELHPVFEIAADGA